MGISPPENAQSMQGPKAIPSKAGRITSRLQNRPQGLGRLPAWRALKSREHCQCKTFVPQAYQPTQTISYGPTWSVRRVRRPAPMNNTEAPCLPRRSKADDWSQSRLCFPWLQQCKAKRQNSFTDFPRHMATRCSMKFCKKTLGPPPSRGTLSIGCTRKPTCTTKPTCKLIEQQTNQATNQHSTCQRFNYATNQHSSPRFCQNPHMIWSRGQPSSSCELSRDRNHVGICTQGDQSGQQAWLLAMG